MLEYDFSNQVDKFLKKCDSFVKKRIFKKIDDLLVNSTPSDMKILNTKFGNLSRVRVGEYRILYRVDVEKSHLVILFIEKRNKVYGYVKEESEKEYGM
ncbi:MAG: type II toxin-antitoxin system RelE/ParE family toxin [Candidatus Pacearchaeota archaeon]|nr:type II toxin-antitoxin system RelE/ParE family toxin [Candidatus Pacearchaeota archaeon]